MPASQLPGRTCRYRGSGRHKATTTKHGCSVSRGTARSCRRRRCFFGLAVPRPLVAASTRSEASSANSGAAAPHCPGRTGAQRLCITRPETAESSSPINKPRVADRSQQHSAARLRLPRVGDVPCGERPRHRDVCELVVQRTCSDTPYRLCPRHRNTSQNQRYSKGFPGRAWFHRRRVPRVGRLTGPFRGRSGLP
jgi:hypothetical protein